MRDTKGEVGGVEFCHGKPKPEIDSALKIYLKAFNIFLCIYVCVKVSRVLFYLEGSIRSTIIFESEKIKCNLDILRSLLKV